MAISVPFSICGSQFTALNCDGSPDLTVEPIVYCGLTDVTRSSTLTDAVDVSDPGGYPGKICFSYSSPGVVDFWEVAVTTCSIYDPRLDAMLGYSDVIVDDQNVIQGSMAKAKANEACICACGEDACQRKVALIVWSLNMCPGKNSTFHPAGRNMVTVYPGLEFQDAATTFSLNANVQGRTYTARGYENPNFGQGPADIVPANAALADRCYYEFYSNECPPGGCDCGDCGANSPAPLVFA